MPSALDGVPKATHRKIKAHDADSVRQQDIQSLLGISPRPRIAVTVYDARPAATAQYFNLSTTSPARFGLSVESKTGPNGPHQQRSRDRSRLARAFAFCVCPPLSICKGCIAAAAQTYLAAGDSMRG